MVGGAPEGGAFFFFKARLKAKSSPAVPFGDESSTRANGFLRAQNSSEHCWTHDKRKPAHLDYTHSAAQLFASDAIFLLV